jgi:DNA-binding NtrC family response regulator
MPKARILCIDDEDSPREALRFILKDRYEVVGKTSGTAGLAAVEQEGPFDVVLLDMKMPDFTGLEVLEKILARQPHQPVVMVTAISDARTVVQAMKLGAADYLNKPFDADEIRLVVERLVREGALRREGTPRRVETQDAGKFDQIIGASAAMQRVYALVKRLLDTETTVLITGETGTGKELIARALHFHSVRKDGPFMPVHCAAIPSELLESELFGHEKGAFTGAVTRRIGMFEAATGGTLFLDEIGEMPMGTQTKLLRAIQEREIRRVGSQETIRINVRLVCATNRNLEAEVKKGTFREDLFYRINVVPVLLPSLRERREDVPTLVLHFTQRFAKEFGRPAPQFTPTAMERLVRYAWPGNVRELEHAIERLLVTCDANPIDAEHLPFVIAQPVDEPAPAVVTVPSAAAVSAPVFGGREAIDLTQLTDDLERQAIEAALLRSGGVMTEAAKMLKITRRILRYKMDKLGLGGGKEDVAGSSVNS